MWRMTGDSFQKKRLQQKIGKAAGPTGVVSEMMKAAAPNGYSLLVVGVPQSG